MEQFNKEYGLDVGPQLKPFGKVLLERGIADESKAASVVSSASFANEIENSERDGDRQLVEEILIFSRTLLENCGNRSLYGSSERLSDLLNTTSLSLLSTTLNLMVRLAQRYHASRQRSSNPSSALNNALLASHYSIDLEKVQKLAEPLKLPPLPQTTSQATSNKGKGKEKIMMVPAETDANAQDMLSLLQEAQPLMNGSSRNAEFDLPSHSPYFEWDEWVGVLHTGLVTATEDVQTPATPTPTRRPSNLSRPSRLSRSEDSPDTAPYPTPLPPEGTLAKAHEVEFPATAGEIKSIGDLMRHTESWSKEVRYQVLTRLRVARALLKSLETRQEILGIRMLAITNLAYIYSEENFQHKILQQDSNEPRNLQIVNQLCDLLQPPATKAPFIPIRLQTHALGTLEALAKHRLKASDVCAALSVNVNHGVLFYLLRKAINDLGVDDAAINTEQEEWREAVFALLDTLPSSSPRTGEALIGAGVLDILVEVLNLRTQKVERSYPKTLTFLNNVVGPIRDAFQTLANAKGLEAISSLMAYEVDSAMERADKGDGLRVQYRNRVTDYQIPFFSQQTLRMVFKIISQMMSNNSGNFDRLLRNFIDSPNLLSGLRNVIINPTLFGSSVWSGAVNIMSSFIHNEPTSYAIISEAGLSKGFLEALSTRPLSSTNGPGSGGNAALASEVTNSSENIGSVRSLPEPTADTGTLMSYFSTDHEVEARPSDYVLAKGILPATDAIVAIPHAFGAICLNHSGMELFKHSNALDNFFEIFESPIHAKSMTSERELASVLGNSFDELVRHHPPLKLWVLSSLLKMIGRIKNFCISLGKKYNSGAKLWLRDSDGRSVVAGEPYDPTSSVVQEVITEDGDVVMGDASAEGAILQQAQSHEPPPPSQQAVNEEADDKDSPSITRYINVAMKFLSTFLQNPQMCNAFVDAGGADRVLELATLPSLPYDFNIHEAGQEIMKVIHLLAESKPHLVLPPLLQRTQAAVDTLTPLYTHTSDEGFFEDFTPSNGIPPINSKAISKAAIATNIVQSLVHVHTFGNILFEIFISPPYNSRSTQTPFHQVNLTDVYRKLIQSLGFLHRACIWECLLVQKRLPETWKQDTRVRGFGMGGSEADEVLGFIGPSNEQQDHESTHGDNNASATPTNGNAIPLSSKKSSISKDEKTAAFQNVRTLRFLLTQVPSTLVQFLRGLGKSLVSKKRLHNPDIYLRQNASLVADAISDASLAMFHYVPPHKTGGKDLYDYWVVAMTSVGRVMIEDQRLPQVSTLLLQSFKTGGGLDILKHILTKFRDEILAGSMSTDNERLKAATRGIHIILTFYTQISGHKSIVESTQSQAMQSTDSRPGNPYYFNPHEFLLVLRLAILPVAQTLWESAFLEKADSSIIRSVIGIMRTLLDASEEHGTPKRMLESPARIHQVYEISGDKLRYLTEKGFDEDLAREALYRCMNVQNAAWAYCQRLSHVPGASRLPIPEYDQESVAQSSSSLSGPNESIISDSQHNPPSQTNDTSVGQPIIDEDTTAAATGLTLLGQADRLSANIESNTPAAVEDTDNDNQNLSEVPQPPPAPGVPADANHNVQNVMGMSLNNLQSMLPIVHNEVERVMDQLRQDPSSVHSPPPSISRSQRMAPQGSGTVEDLKAAREEIRKDLIDRALDILNAHKDVSFELADLIRTATSKTSELKDVRAEIGTTLIQSLVSFELDEDFSSVGKKIAAYANLLALVLQDKEFFEASSSELKDNFDCLIGFIKISPDSPLGMSTTPWIAQTLLVVEKILAEDSQPPQIEWTAPDPSGLPARNDIVQSDPPIVSEESRLKLFDALLELMPHTKKDEPIVLSISRVLVILTRTRSIASRLAEKKNIQRLFLMIKQLSGVTDDRLTSATLCIVRHMFEDEEIIRRIIRSEIRNNFETRPNRPMDAQGYARTQHHLAIRSPEMFVEVSNEILEISGYDSAQRPQTLKLKQDTPKESIGSWSNHEAEVVHGERKEVEADHSMHDKTPSTEGDQAAGVKTKVAEKAPVVECPSGVIHYLLTELLGYKDADDTLNAVPGKLVNGDTKHAMTGDTKPAAIEPSNNTLSTSGADSLSNTASSTPLNKSLLDSKKSELIPEENPIHMYRCFILQCLTELLLSYNQAKVEFINFSRKADSKATTPSKPRSGVLNYLLNEAIPEGPLNVDKDSLDHIRRNSVSNWAISTIVALCIKTNELGYDRKPGTIGEDDQPDLVFVRKFVLEHALKAYKDANASEEDLNIKYGRLTDLADLFHRLLLGTLLHRNATPPGGLDVGPQKAIAKIMFEKNFITVLTSSIADINLNFKSAEKPIKYILRSLRQLTSTAVDLSETSSISTTLGQTDTDDISSATSVSDVEAGREETPDLFRNSTLGMFEPGREDQSSSESSRSEDEEMYDDEYYEGMEEDDEVEHDADEVISDEDEELGDVGPVEGLHGDRGMDVEVVIDEEDDDELSDNDDPDESADDEDIEELDEINADDENASLVDGEEEEWQDEMDDAEEDEEQYDGLDEDNSQDQDAENTVLDLERGFASAEARLRRLEGLEDNNADLAMDVNEDRYMDDVMQHENDEEVDEDDEDIDEEAIGYELEQEEGRRIPAPPWGWDDTDDDPFPYDHQHRHHNHHGHRHHPRHLPDPWTIFPNGPPTHRGNMSPYRANRNPTASARSNDDGTNPLLRRSDRPPDLVNPRLSRSALSDSLALSDYFIHGMDVGGLARDGPVSIVHNLIQAIGQGNNHAITAMPGPGGAVHVQLTGESLPRELQAVLQSGYRAQHISDPARSEGRISVPMFIPQQTFQRWTEEAKMLFGASEVQNRGQRVTNALLRAMVPPALEKKKKKDEEDKRQREELEQLRERERKLREQAEKLAQEVQEKKEAEAAAEAAAAQARHEADTDNGTATHVDANVQGQTDNSSVTDEPMEGVESGRAHVDPATEGHGHDGEDLSQATEEASLSHPTERQVVTFNGAQLDITDMGIDMAYLDALPEELRNEVLMTQLAVQRAQTAAAGDAPTGIDSDFLEALPADIRAELLQQEAQERRRREREETRRQQSSAGGPAHAEEMDPASFLASLDPQLRQHVLMEQDEEMLAHLPAEIAAEARALGGDRSIPRFAGMPRVTRPAGLGRDVLSRPPQPAKKSPRKQIVQMLDKSGIATILRLMFIQQQSEFKLSLNRILLDVAQNKQNRAEVVSLLLSILQDGSTDSNAVERSFTQLSVRAKQGAAPRTPIKRPTTEMPGASTTNAPELKITPLMVIQQCLGALVTLTVHNPHVTSFFLGENEMAFAIKNKSNRKGKSKETKASKYPVNALLSLLDRVVITENMGCVEQLANLLQTVTGPLIMLLRKEKGNLKEKKQDEAMMQDQPSTETTATEVTPVVAIERTSIETASETADEAGLSPGTEAQAIVSSDEQGRADGAETTVAPTAETSETKDSASKRTRALNPPTIPDDHLRLVVNIIIARECPSSTFRATLSTMTNLCAISGAKDVFGKKLVESALDLGRHVLDDLNGLIPQIIGAASGKNLQGVALTKFSPQSSDQAKLLRVLKALDYLFDPKREEARTKSDAEPEDSAHRPSSSKADLVTSLYEDATFGLLWNKLGDCLSAIRQASGMLNVATILLPLVEALMVVCTNTTIKDAPLNKNVIDFAITSPPPESRMESLFFKFTEEHRKILNDLVRQNPKLMSGTFQLLVKNPKVLEFDNKRNYFTRRLHSRGTETRHPQPPLQLAVRRDQVFLDSFKFLSFKSGEEIKYGKLSIRFHGEEGVDAGGVTREWFQVLSRQMFNPDYALFIPVASDRTTFHPNKLSNVNEEHLMFFKFIGRIIGKALYEGRALDCHFSRAVYKRILGKTVSIKDMETLDLDYYKSLLWMLENDIAEIITETMSIETDDFGVTEVVDLVPNGRRIPVTEDNKQEYVQLVVEYRLTGSVQTQLEKFLEGKSSRVNPALQHANQTKASTTSFHQSSSQSLTNKN